LYISETLHIDADPWMTVEPSGHFVLSAHLKKWRFIPKSKSEIRNKEEMFKQQEWVQRMNNI